MAQQVIGIGTAANDGTGDPLRTAFDKANDNFTELYASAGGGSVPADLSRAVGWVVDYASGRYYSPHVTGASSLSVSITASRIYLQPFYCRMASTWDRIGVSVSAATAGATARLGIYSTLASGWPGALVLDAGTVSIAATGAQEATISQALSADALYWFAFVSSASASSAIAGVDERGLRPVVAQTTLSLSGPRGTLVYDHGSATLPGTFDGLTLSSQATGPSVLIRAA